MPFKKSALKALGTVAAAGLALSLAACSGGQSVAEACQIADKTVSEANTEAQDLMSDALSGDGDLGSLLAPVNDALAEAQKKVTNEEVSSALDNVAADFSALSDSLDGFEMPSFDDIDMTDPKAMDELDEMQEQAEAKGAELQERSDALQKSGKELQELCNN